MTPAEKFDAAGITRVAFVDDDVGERISLAQLAEHDPDTAGTLNDAEDPDRMALMELLKRKEGALESEAALLEGLNDPTLRPELPERYREAIAGLLTERADKRAAIEAVRDMLIGEFGIAVGNIAWFDSPETFPQDREFDLVIVDYYLRGPSNAETVPFLQRCIRESAARANPLLLVLASSHAASIRADFRALRQQLGITTSRFRILQKPNDTPALLHRWRRSLLSLAADRSAVVPIESFVREVGATVKQAAEEMSKQLWEMDAHALGMLHDLAKADHDDFARYLDEVLSRRVLGFLEHNVELRKAARTLTTVLTAPGVRREALEAGDSRAALLELVDDVTWRRQRAWETDERPAAVADANEDLERRTEWFYRNIRFGSVLRAPEGSYWVNVTQACDILQASREQRATETMLLIRGSRTDSSYRPDGQGFANSDGFRQDNSRGSLWWDVRRTLNPVVNDFIEMVTNGDWRVVSELRLEHAQRVVAQYAASISRVAVPNLPTVWKLTGVVVDLYAMYDSADADAFGGCAIVGDAVRTKNGMLLHVPFTEIEKVQAECADFAGLNFDKFDEGVKASKPSNGVWKEPMGTNPRVVYLMQRPLTFAEVKALIEDQTKTKLAANPRRPDNQLWVLLSPDNP